MPWNRAIGLVFVTLAISACVEVPPDAPLQGVGDSGLDFIDAGSPPQDDAGPRVDLPETRDTGTSLDAGASTDSGGGPSDAANADSGPDRLDMEVAADAAADSGLDSGADMEPDVGPPPSTVRYFGYHERWSSTPETGENTTVVGWPGQGNINRYQFIYVGHEVLELDANGRAIRPHSLRADWQQSLQQLQTDVDLEVQNGDVTGFNLGYSLLWNGLPMADFIAYADEVRRLFPDADIWWMEEPPVFTNDQDRNGNPVGLTIPTSVNLVSVYSWYGPWENNDFQPNYVQNEKAKFANSVFPKLSGDQRVILVPTAGAWNNFLTVCNLDCHDNAMLALANAYRDWAREEDLIVGIAPYAWTFYGGGTGVDGLPKTRQAYEQIGQEIEANHP